VSASLPVKKKRWGCPQGIKLGTPYNTARWVSKAIAGNETVSAKVEPFVFLADDPEKGFPAGRKFVA